MAVESDADQIYTKRKKRMNRISSFPLAESASVKYYISAPLRSVKYEQETIRFILAVLAECLTFVITPKTYANENSKWSDIWNIWYITSHSFLTGSLELTNDQLPTSVAS